MTTRLFPFNLNPPRLGFPLPMAKVALTGIPAVSAKKKRRSWLPFILPAAGVGADYLFNQGKVSKGLWGALNSLFASPVTPIPPPRTNTANTETANTANTVNTETANTRLPAPVTAAPTVAKPANPPAAPLPAEPRLPSSDHVNASSDPGDEFHKYLNYLDRWNSQKSLDDQSNVGAAPPSKHPYVEAALDTARTAGDIGSLASWGPGRVLKAVGNVARPISAATGVYDAYNNPINREVGKAYAVEQALQEGLWLNPTTAAAMAVYSNVKPDLQANLDKSQWMLHQNAAAADAISEQYRTAKDEVAKGLKPPEYLYSKGKEIENFLRSYNPILAKQEWRSKIWDPIVGEGSTGAVNLTRPALIQAAKKLKYDYLTMPRFLGLSHTDFFNTGESPLAGKNRPPAYPAMPR